MQSCGHGPGLSFRGHDLDLVLGLSLLTKKVLLNITA